MKLFRAFFSRHRSNKKKLSSSPTNIQSNNAMQSINQSLSPCCDPIFNLFDRHTKCTCHYFTLNEHSLGKTRDQNLLSMHSTSCSSSSPRLSINIIPSLEYLTDAQYILTVADFCFWYDIRSTLFDVIDRVVAMNETHHFLTQSTLINDCRSPINTIHRPKTSIAIQTSRNYEQRRNAKVQTNTLTLFPLQTQQQQQHLYSSTLFLN